MSKTKLTDLSTIKKISLPVLLIAVLVAIVFIDHKYTTNQKPPASARVGQDGPVQKETAPIVQLEDEDKKSIPNPQPTGVITQELPEQAKLKVPFLVQAPYANWDPLHEDACEEASLLMVASFLNKVSVDSDDLGDEEIQKLVGYETKNNYQPSVSLENLNLIANDYFKLSTGRIEETVTTESIKKEIASGKPVIIPAAGRVLPNPYYKQPGPNYHMLVVIGYDKNGFITNDPGTKRGQDFYYKTQDLLKSIHNWDENNILNGESKYLVFD